MYAAKVKIFTFANTCSTHPFLCLLIPAMAAAEETPTKYTDAASLTIVGKAQPGGPAFERIEVARYPELTPTVTKYYRYPTGLVVAFRTDSRNIPRPLDNGQQTGGSEFDAHFPAGARPLHPPRRQMGVRRGRGTEKHRNGSMKPRLWRTWTPR